MTGHYCACHHTELLEKVEDTLERSSPAMDGISAPFLFIDFIPCTRLGDSAIDSSHQTADFRVLYDIGLGRYWN